ncbi:MAG: hypothetical protein RBQ94_04905 [Methanimicrococcus sp.]|nr:hypothetical protein [Methanimicrococcus sp.]
MGILNRIKTKKSLVSVAVIFIVLFSLTVGLGGVAYATGVLTWGGEDDDLRVRNAIDSMITKANAELKKATDALNATKSDLQNTTAELEAKNNTLGETETKLKDTLSDLQAKNDELNSTNITLNSVRSDLQAKNDELNETNDKLAKAISDMEALADYAEGRLGDINTFDENGSSDGTAGYPELVEGMKVNKGEIVSYKNKNYQYLKDHEFTFQPGNENEHPDYPGTDMWKLIE